MIAVDTSIVIAILEQEPETASLEECLVQSGRRVMGAPTKFELMQVAGGRKGALGVETARSFLIKHQIEVVAWTEAMSDLATDAFLRFGKGRHPAALNFGDCMAYALAKSLDAPLLFKGDDFRLTDIVPAV